MVSGHGPEKSEKLMGLSGDGRYVPQAHTASLPTNPVPVIRGDSTGCCTGASLGGGGMVWAMGRQVFSDWDSLPLRPALLSCPCPGALWGSERTMISKTKKPRMEQKVHRETLLFLFGGGRSTSP